VSSFFVALRFAPNVECIDLTSSVQEILFKVNSWEDRREGMDITIEHLLWNQLPDFVLGKSSQDSCSDLRDSGGGDDEADTLDDLALSAAQRGGAESGKRRNTNEKSIIIGGQK
jgi:hypothetical protein